VERRLSITVRSWRSPAGARRTTATIAGRRRNFLSAAKYGYLFQGQRYAWQQKRTRDSNARLPPTAFVNFIENHDQVANSATVAAAAARRRRGAIAP
jgi:maltooligosyltrehalose trehalohydrolase